MKALTLTQPWATLVAIGAKKIETRGWRTAYRGPLAIHAAKGFPGEARYVAQFKEPFKSILAAHFDVGGNLPTGCVIATCALVDCVLILSSFDGANVDGEAWPLTDQEEAFGDYTPGRYAWLLADMAPLPEPVPARGSLGLWEWSA